MNLGKRARGAAMPFAHSPPVYRRRACRAKLQRSDRRPPRLNCRLERIAAADSLKSKLLIIKYICRINRVVRENHPGELRAWIKLAPRGHLKLPVPVETELHIEAIAYQPKPVKHSDAHV